MDNVRGKEVSLVRTTVKIPGQRPKGSEAPRSLQANGQGGGGGSSGGLSGSGKIPRKREGGVEMEYIFRP